MTAGYPIESQDGNPYWAQLTQGDNWVENAFMLPLGRAPGGQWEYSSGSTLLLSAIVARASGMSALAFAEQHLFGPLEAPIPLWGQDPAGNYLGGWAMYITPRNMARFGRVYLESGQFGGQQIVPGEWVDESLVGYNAVDWPMGALGQCEYGYLWYAGTVGAYEVRMAWGHGGQIILLVPELNLVVVTATDADNSFSAGYNQSLRVFRFIADHIVSSVVEVQ
jgi:CubicO group peptidase (beta-lactamase class C family)